QHYEADPFFYPKTGEFNQPNADLLSKVHQALTIIQFKLEGQIIARQPDFEMENRLFLQQAVTGAVEIDGRTYPLSHECFQTVDPQHPYKLTAEEQEVIQSLGYSFRHAPQIKAHMDFILRKGSMYL
ncbi:fructose-bisphosphatase class III, partial [Enterococcus faecium]